jgi:hypothetical protein
VHVKHVEYAQSRPFIFTIGTKKNAQLRRILSPPYKLTTIRSDGKRERNGPRGNLLLQALNLLDFAGRDLRLEVLELVVFLGQIGLDLLAQLDASVDVACDPLEVVLAEATRRHSWRADANTHGRERRLVAGCRVLVARDVDLLEDGFDAGAVEGEGLEVDEDHVVVCAVGDKLEAEFVEGDFELLSVLDDLLLVELEVFGLSLLERNGERGDGVVVRAALVAGEDGEVDGTLKVVECLLACLCVRLAHALAEEDHGAAGAAEGLVRGGGDEVAVGEGRLVDAGGDEPGDVGHVHHQVAANLVGDLAHTGVVDLTAVCRGPGDEDLGAVHERVLLELVVVDEASVEVYAVREGLEVGRDGRDPV